MILRYHLWTSLKRIIFKWIQIGSLFLYIRLVSTYQFVVHCHRHIFNRFFLRFIFNENDSKSTRSVALFFEQITMDIQRNDNKTMYCFSFCVIMFHDGHNSSFIKKLDLRLKIQKHNAKLCNSANLYSLIQLDALQLLFLHSDYYHTNFLIYISVSTLYVFVINWLFIDCWTIGKRR